MSDAQSTVAAIIHTAMAPIALSTSDGPQSIRLPAPYRRREIARIIAPGEDYYINEAGVATDGTLIFELYWWEP